jgi:hypothetical protein
MRTVINQQQQLRQIALVPGQQLFERPVHSWVA